MYGDDGFFHEGITLPPSANLPALRASKVFVPYFFTESALITYSPFERYAGIESEVAVPAPRTLPPVLNPFTAPPFAFLTTGILDFSKAVRLAPSFIALYRASSLAICAFSLRFCG